MDFFLQYESAFIKTKHLNTKILRRPWTFITCLTTLGTAFKTLHIIKCSITPRVKQVHWIIPKWPDHYTRPKVSHPCVTSVTEYEILLHFALQPNVFGVKSAYYRCRWGPNRFHSVTDRLRGTVEVWEKYTEWSQNGWHCQGQNYPYKSCVHTTIHTHEAQRFVRFAAWWTAFAICGDVEWKLRVLLVWQNGGMGPQ